MPERDYLTGHLWPKHDRAVALVDKHAPANVLRNGRLFDVVPGRRHPPGPGRRRLIEVIQPAVLDDIGGVSARQGWIPLDLVARLDAAT